MDLTEGIFAISIVGVSVAVLKQSFDMKRENSKNNRHITLSEVDKKYTEIKVCNEIHKNIDEKLACIPIIKDTVVRLETKVDILMNGK